MLPPRTMLALARQVNTLLGFPYQDRNPRTIGQCVSAAASLRKLLQDNRHLLGGTGPPWEAAGLSGNARWTLRWAVRLDQMLPAAALVGGWLESFPDGGAFAEQRPPWTTPSNLHAATRRPVSGFVTPRPAAEREFEAQIRAATVPAIPAPQEECRQAKPGDPPPPGGFPYLFRITGESWHLRFQEEEGIYPDSQGAARVGRLLKQPHTPMPALQLMDAAPQAGMATHTSQELIDGTAMESLRREAKRLIAEREKAKLRGEAQFVDELTEELEPILAQLKQSTALRGRSRTLGAGSPNEKARAAAQKSIRRFLQSVSEAMPRLAKHLRQAIEAEGSAFVYRPSPAIPWEF